ncbi:MAG: hypothetical protein IT385_08045 [Deltaproteobacteria bacterium]|nr:hypothetical protein [Deltaproteobacteria bacterium]
MTSTSPIVASVTLALLAAACGDKQPPTATPSAATAALPAPVAPAPTPSPAPTPRPALGEMPDDAAHAGLRPRAPQGGALPQGHPPIGQGGGVGVGGAGPSGTMGSGAPPAGPMAGMGAGPAETGVERPLPLEGSGSVAELRARLALIADKAKHAPLEEAFRKLFTVDRPARDGARAREILEPLATDADPKVASLALRMLGYVSLNSGFDAAGATARYQQALALDPEYGELHYALAFVLAISDRTAGKTHFDKAMKLGVPDVRRLGDQFYGGPSH